MGPDYDATVEALTSYPVQPTITASLNIKGDASPEVLRQLVHVASEHGLAVNTTLTATFSGEEAEGMQLRLFGPPSETADAAEVADEPYRFVVEPPPLGAPKGQ